MGICKDKKRGDWIYRFGYQGKNYGGRGFKTKKAAEAARAERRKEVAAAHKEPAVENENSNFRKVAYDYLDQSERRFAKKTNEVKRLCYKSFYNSLGADLPMDQITIQHIENYLKTKKTNNNYNIHRKELLCLWNFAKKRKLVSSIPLEDIPKMPHTPKRKNIPTEQQILQLILACEPKIEKPLFLTILHTLGRVDEVLRLTWDDVNFEKHTVTLWTRKRRGGIYEADPMPMGNDLHDVLLPMFRNRIKTHEKIKAQIGKEPETQWVFINPRTGTRFNRRPKMMKALCHRAFDPGCKSVTQYSGPVFGFHSLRHFMASYLADSGKWSVKTLQGLLRHKEARTTEIYLHQLGDGLREAITSLDGKFMVSGSGVGSGDNTDTTGHNESHANK